jgi:hypothetical protein
MWQCKHIASFKTIVSVMSSCFRMLHDCRSTPCSSSLGLDFKQ